MSDSFPLCGGCDCGAIRYEMMREPMYVHACHCTWCQRETGSAFVLNAIIEASEVRTTKGTPIPFVTPSDSGGGQTIWRCDVCFIALWSNYGSGGDRIRYLRAGTLDKACLIVPDIHIFTNSKHPWIQIPKEHNWAEEFYDAKRYWPEESLERFANAKTLV